MMHHPPAIVRMASVRTLMSGLLMSAALFLFPPLLMAEEDPKGGEEHHEAAGDIGHKLHPIHADFQSKISGWLTAIAQGTMWSKKDANGQKNDMAEGSLSMDLFYEATLDGSGVFLVHLDVQQGGGVAHAPALFTAPNGNTTGPNNDIESFGNDQAHLDEAWYETTFADARWTLTLGQLDPTAYFDTNNYANNERFQFIANQFGNNPTIEFGGTGNFYGAGFRLTYSPAELVDVTLGALDGDGDYAEMFDRPFVIAELDLKPKLAGKEGNYRFYAWQNSLTHYGDFLTMVGGTAGSESDPPAPSKPVVGDQNTGFGISLDQVLTDNLGVWARLGIQDGDVAQFDRHVSAGLQISGGVFGREEDVAGIGVGMTMVSDAYKATSNLSDNELYAEAYYNMTVKEGFQVTPDIQYVSNPGGDGSQDPFFVYGVRAGVMF
ncbi:MAG: carbohydrate porin [Nitrospirae bacterium]|nr:carbohydrate porin [Nitrospirota bacterium]